MKTLLEKVKGYIQETGRCYYDTSEFYTMGRAESFAIKRLGLTAERLGHKVKETKGVDSDEMLWNRINSIEIGMIKIPVDRRYKFLPKGHIKIIFNPSYAHTNELKKISLPILCNIGKAKEKIEDLVTHAYEIVSAEIANLSI